MKDQTPLLALAAAYIDAGWTQKAYARRQDGTACDSVSLDAVCWCLIGALNAAINTRPIGGLVLLDVLSEVVKGNLVTFNDNALNHAEILEALSEAACREG